MKLNAKQLRLFARRDSKRGSEKTSNEIYIVLDNVLDTYNIGSIFRLADAVAAKKVYLCAGTEIPPNHRIKKASINTTEIVDWSYSETALQAISELRKANSDIQIIAIEQSAKSIQYDKFEYKMPICLIVGNETTGVSKEVLDSCDVIVEIPMFGVNISLNVMVSLAVVAYHAISRASSVYEAIKV